MSRSIAQRRWIRRIQVVLLVIALIGTALVQREARAGSGASWISGTGVLLSIVCLTAVQLLYLWSRKQIPREAKRLVMVSRARWESAYFVHFDVAIPIAFLGMLVESLFVSLSNLLLMLPVLYIVATIVVYYEARAKTVVGSWVALFAFFASSSSVPFSVIAFQDPELLNRVFGQFGVTVPVSRSMSYLFIPWVQMAMVASSALLLSQAWRSRLLLRNGLGVTDLQDRYELALERISRMPGASEFAEVFSDVPRLLSLFEQGNFATIVGPGWGMVDRALSTNSTD